MKTALLLIAHGSREPQANADLGFIAAALREREEYLCVEPSFLELAAPEADSAAARCVEQGATCVVIVPYFLSAGVHVHRDLSAIRDRLAERFPHVAFQLAPPLGRHPLLVEIVAQRAREA